MSLNNIKLGDLIVSELYRTSLLATEARPAAGPLAKTMPSSAAPGSMTDPSPVAGSGPVRSAAPAADPFAAAPSQPVLRPTAGNTPSATPAHETKPTASSSLVSNTPASVPGTSAPTASSPVPPTPGYKFLGNNRRNITILVQSPGVAFLPDDQLAFLTKMLEACRMNIGDVAIINQATAPVNITVLKQQLHPSILLLFGMEPVAIKLPMNFPVFKIQPYDACTYLSAPSLEDLVRPGEENKLLKSKLWMCLKTIFEI